MCSSRLFIMVTPYGNSLDFTAILDDMQPCTIIHLLSLKAVQAYSGNILIQITEVRINFNIFILCDTSTFNSCLELTQLPDLTRRVYHPLPYEQIWFFTWPV